MIRFLAFCCLFLHCNQLGFVFSHINTLMPTDAKSIGFLWVVLRFCFDLNERRSLITRSLFTVNKREAYVAVIYNLSRGLLIVKKSICWQMFNI